jgi:hypothetical protein
MFEKASRLKLRFDSPVSASLLVEDLWGLPLTSTKTRPVANLDDIAVALHKQLKNDSDVSFVVKSRKSDETIQLKFDIVKHIIEVRVAEADVAAEKKSNSDKKQKILALIADKEDDALAGKSVDELRALAESL